MILKIIYINPPLPADCHSVGCLFNIKPSILGPISKKNPGDKYKNNYDESFKEAGMAVPKSIKTKVRMIRLNQVQSSPLLFPPPPPNELYGVAIKAVS